MEKKKSERGLHPNSLKNLELGPVTTRSGKIKRSYTILPEYHEWLSQEGNASGKLNDLLEKQIKYEVNASQNEAKYENLKQAVIEILESALPLPANKGGAIKKKIKEALKILNE
ncbi:MAG: hypothetical protein SWZ49_04105 [Cyanobacteriota bacterium]|nr:hypothetical protein [Cyanobacteriota bacterium]